MQFISGGQAFTVRLIGSLYQKREICLDTPAATSIMQVTPATPPLSAVATGKRPAVTSDDEEDSDADEFADPEENLSSPVPNTQHRVSGRMRKKSRLLDGYIA